VSQVLVCGDAAEFVNRRRLTAYRADIGTPQERDP
jgi:hypothetical protein